jgi:hypothetical protein
MCLQNWSISAAAYGFLYAKCENLDHLKEAAVDNRLPSAKLLKLERLVKIPMVTLLVYTIVVR